MNEPRKVVSFLFPYLPHSCEWSAQEPTCLKTRTVYFCVRHLAGARTPCHRFKLHYILIADLVAQAFTGIMQAAQQTELEAMTDMFNKCAAQELSLPRPFCAPHTTLPVAQDDGPVLSKMCRNVQRA